MSTAIVIGATGLVGKCLVQQLLGDPRYAQVRALVRRATSVRADKYQEQVVDFERPERLAEYIQGDVLFSSLGTTRSQAGSLAAQRTVDYTYQFEVAKLAAAQAVDCYVLVSSGGANAHSFSSYLKMKGELERDVQRLGFPALHILQPGLLTGARDAPRTAEGIAGKVIGALNAVGLFRDARPISGDQVAQAMRHAATLGGIHTHGPATLFDLAAQAPVPGAVTS